MQTDISKTKHPFSADRAIEEIAQDRLGRSFFASHLADAVCSWNENDSLVLALYGEWGAGKTSVKNLFKCHCESKGKPYIVEFNPWQWSAQEKIFEAFFQLIGERLGKKDIADETKQLAKKWKYFAASWRIGAELVKNVQNAALQLILLAAVAGWMSTIPSGLMQIISGLISVTSLVMSGLVIVLPGLFEKMTAFLEAKATYFEKDLDQRRRELIKELKQLKKPIIVIIDDIDRLNPEEIKLVIQLVKANSDLPKVVYFLLFQQETVINALADFSHQGGADFLEKIVQIGFDIPQVPEGTLHAILFEELNEMLAGIDFGKRWDKERWDSIFNDYLKFYFRTLRDVYRFLSMMRFHINIYKNKNVFEVNPIDLIVLQALRVFDHPVYEQVKDSFLVYTDYVMRALFFKQEKSHKLNIILDDVLKGVEEGRRKRVEGMIISLFPQASPNPSNNDNNVWDRDLRICHENHFAKYFELALRKEAISELEISLLLKSASDSNAVSQILTEYVKRGRLMELLDRLEQHVETVATESISSFLLGILRVSEEFPPVQKPGLFNFPPEVIVTRLTRNLLLRCSETSRVNDVCKLFSDSGALTVPSMVIDADERRKNDDPLKQFLFKESELKTVQQACIENIKKAASDGRLLKSERMLWLLQCWKQWGGTEEAVNWAKEFVKDAGSAMKITMAAVSVSTVSGHRGTRQYDNLLLKWLEQFVSLEQVWNYLSSLDKGTLNKREQHVIALFEQGLENKKRGEQYDQIHDKDALFSD